MRKIIVILAVTLLTACGPSRPAKDYQAMAACHERLGIDAGKLRTDAPADDSYTKAFDQCVKEEHAANLLKQQEQQFQLEDQRQQEERAYRAVLPR